MQEYHTYVCTYGNGVVVLLAVIIATVAIVIAVAVLYRKQSKYR